MLKRFVPLAGLTLLLSLAAVPAAHAGPRMSFNLHVGSGPVVRPYTVVTRERPGYHWQRGYYVRVGFGRRWVPGRWVRDPHYRGYWRDERWSREHRYDRDDRRR